MENNLNGWIGVPVILGKKTLGGEIEGVIKNNKGEGYEFVSETPGIFGKLESIRLKEELLTCYINYSGELIESEITKK